MGDNVNFAIRVNQEKSNAIEKSHVSVTYMSADIKNWISSWRTAGHGPLTWARVTKGCTTIAVVWLGSVLLVPTAQSHLPSFLQFKCEQNILPTTKNQYKPIQPITGVVTANSWWLLLLLLELKKKIKWQVSLWGKLPGCSLTLTEKHDVIWFGLMQDLPLDMIIKRKNTYNRVLWGKKRKAPFGSFKWL